MLLVLIGMGASASTDEIQLTWGENTSSSDGWSSRVVTNAKEMIKQGDFLIFSFDEASSSDQYAICNESGDKIYTVGCKNNQNWYNCANGQKDFVLTVTKKFYDAIQSGGLRLQYKGLKSLKGYIKRIDYKPTGSDVTEIMSTPQYIENWYSDGFVLHTDQDYVNKTLRVVCMETGDDAYAFLKRNDDGWPSLMSGSDKFSIAGWKYFEIKINGELNGLLRGNGLRIGGNNYYIAGIYVYDDGTTAPNWTEDNSDIVDTYTFSDPIDGTNGWSDWSKVELMALSLNLRDGARDSRVPLNLLRKSPIPRIILSDCICKMYTLIHRFLLRMGVMVGLLTSDSASRMLTVVSIIRITQIVDPLHITISS